MGRSSEEVASVAAGVRAQRAVAPRAAEVAGGRHHFRTRGRLQSHHHHVVQAFRTATAVPLVAR